MFSISDLSSVLPSDLLSPFNKEEKIIHIYLKAKAEKCRRSFTFFVKEMWDQITNEQLIWNWHLDLLCNELQDLLLYVMARLPAPYDLIINIPPGTTKSTIITQMLPAWGWIAVVPPYDAPFPWFKSLVGKDLKFITASYSALLSLEHAELTRDIVRSERFRAYFPELIIRRDKEAKSHFKNNFGGSRYATSVGGTVTGMHGHIITIDDPLNPHQSASDAERETANHWIDTTLSTRKIDKKVTPTVLVMQRLHKQDPTGHWLEKTKAKEGGRPLRFICLPGRCDEEGFEVYPKELKKKYINGLLDPVRMPIEVLEDMKVSLGSLNYAAQCGQSPRDPKGSMFKREHFEIVDAAPVGKKRAVRGWDLAGTSEIEAAIKKNKRPAFTASIKMREVDGIIYIEDATRARLAPNGVRQALRNTASQDGVDTIISIPQDPGQAGKAQAQSLVALLAGFIVEATPESGDKIRRAEPFAAQCEAGNVKLVRGNWNISYLEELIDFPNSAYKDQVDASSRAFNMLNKKRKRAGTW